MILISDVMSAVHSVTGYGLPSLRGPARYRELVRARQAGMYVAHKLTDRGWSSLGRSFNRDHTTVYYSVAEAAPAYIASDPSFAALVQAIEQVSIRVSESRCQALALEVYCGA